MTNATNKQSNKGIKTTCPYCGVGCGIKVVTPANANKPVILGDKNHPANFGKLCIKGKNLGETLGETLGENLGETLGQQNRLAQPLIKGQAQKWSRALDHVASQLSQTIQQHGPDSVAFYVSGQLLTEDYYLANKLMKGFIGSGNIDSNSRLCMASAVVGHKRAFGEDIVPLSYSDVTKADLVVLVGSNLAWCHPVLHQRIMDEKQRRPELKLVVIDPRLTPTAAMADLHLPIKSGSDILLFNGLLDHLAKHWKINSNSQIDGLEAALASAEIDAQKLADTGLDIDALWQFFQLFANTDKVVSLFSQGINQSSQGSDQCNAIINCHLASGKIGREGCGPFSVTGQPNAMGGREVGALANTLASHMEFNNPEQHQTLSEFWQTDRLATKPGLVAVDLFDAMAAGKIKAVWIMATNPLVSMPNSEKVKQALQQCPLVVVSDCVANNDTLAYADVILPSQGWGEKDGTVTNSERRISRQRAFMTPHADAKADWWMIKEVAQRMGFGNAFNYQTAGQIFAEHARLSGANNHGSRAFDISALANISESDYQQMLPTQWPQPAGQRLNLNDQQLFTDGRYFTANQQPKMLAVSLSPLTSHKSSDELRLNTGRYRDQWHTQTRSGKSATLSHSAPEPRVDIHPEDAKVMAVKDNQLALIKNAAGQALLRVRVTDAQRQGELFAPIHWSQSNNNQGAINRLVSANPDAFSGQPALKHSQVTLTPWGHRSEAMLIVDAPMTITDCDYQVSQTISGGICYHLADVKTAQQLFDQLISQIEQAYPASLAKLSSDDPARHSYRQYYYQDDKFVAGLVVAAEKSALAEGWLSRFFQLAVDNDSKRALISTDIEAQRQQKTFCHCLKVSFKQLKQQIHQGETPNVEGIVKNLEKRVRDIQNRTGAGSGCGSCLGDIALTLKEQAISC